MNLPQALDILARVLCPVFTIYQWIVIIAIVLTWVRPDPHNPIVQWINRVTHPLFAWCYDRIPDSIKLFNAYAALLFVVFLHALVPASIQSFNLFLHEGLLFSGFVYQVVGHGIQGLVIVLNSVVWFGIIILAVWFFLTLISPALNNPIVQIVYTLADPIITPIQKYLPRTKVDLSPLVGIAILFAISTFAIIPINGYGVMLSGPIYICR